MGPIGHPSELQMAKNSETMQQIAEVPVSLPSVAPQIRLPGERKLRLRRAPRLASSGSGQKE